MGTRNQTRTRMVASAATLLRERGVAGTSVARVLEHSRGPRGSVQFHFPGGKRELMSDALDWAGRPLADLLDQAADARQPPHVVLGAICAHYRRQLMTSGFRAGCPIGAVAQEAHHDDVLAPAADRILRDWTAAFARVLTGSGQEPARAAEVAETCVAAVEGALMLCRVRRSTAPLDVTERQLHRLL